MLTKLAAGASVLGCLSVLLGAQESGERGTEWPGGAKKEAFEVVVEDGTEIRHGSYEAWHANGERSAKGSYHMGGRYGRWTFYHENGKRSALGKYKGDERDGSWKLFNERGKLLAEGLYDDGDRKGEWIYYTDKGDEDPLLSGNYEPSRLSYAGGAVRGLGELLDGLPHGPWTYYWPEGTVQFCGDFVRGVRRGAWVFQHPDGTYDAGFLSGVYEDGRRVRELEDGTLPEWVVPAESLGSEAASSERRAADASVEDPAPSQELQTRIETALRVPVEEREAEIAGFRRFGDRAALALIERLEAQDLEHINRAIRKVEGEGRLLSQLCGGASFSWRNDEGSYDAASIRRALVRWRSLWRITQGSDFWSIDAALMDGSKDPDALAAPPFPDLGSPTESSMARFRGADAAAVYANRFAAPTAASSEGVQRAIRFGLEWLVSQQGPDGSWDADAFAGDETVAGVTRLAYHDIGVTSLAALAFLGSGSTTREGEHKDVLAAALGWIARQVGPEGKLRSPLPESDLSYDQALAALALCEASAGSPSPALRAVASRAVQWILAARNPDGVWRYGVQPGDNDTSITAWMVQALFAAQRIALDGVDGAEIQKALVASRAWIVSMTEPRTGRIGYDTKGNASVRVAQNEHYPRDRTEAMTAAGLFCHALFGTDPEEKIIPRHVYRLKKAPARWSSDGLSCDMYYWYFANNALYQMDPPAWEAWWEGWSKIALVAQKKNRDAKGSWDPIGPWGFIGGRVYSTAIMVLSLETPQRLPRLHGLVAGIEGSGGPRPSSSQGRSSKKGI